ncbi:FRG domain-containing protein [Niabella hibiscisoli]|uniref:FRG domain-containing protein n=1 Tax=Niabella hibiscisoli TaxID=1825928 RepID=UPI001F0F2D2E|nr:FRG domain-containing protein [Niabella hibiscisoli]MCH5715565.1 FRG domain-containing protein [Niabella hibiscisoli]
MKEKTWNGWESFILTFIKLGKPNDGTVNLFRGQPCAKPLIPKIARSFSNQNTEAIEKKMLNELRLRGSRFLPKESINDLDLLTIAQHHGMATRLLDWSTNPLAALWFACKDRDECSGHFYFYRAYSNNFFDPSKDVDIFNLPYTKILRPKYNNARILAQNGWFSLHGVNQSFKDGKFEGKFIGLDEDPMHF